MWHRVEAFLAQMALLAKQPITSMCDLSTSDGEALISDQGHYQTTLSLLGMRRMLSDPEINAAAGQLREGAASFLTHKGHAVQASFICDPERAGSVVSRQVRATRSVADTLGLNFGNLFAERERVWTDCMVWEDTSLALWTLSGLLDKEETKQEKRRQAEVLGDLPDLTGAQPFWQADGALSPYHRAFVQTVSGALRSAGVSVATLSPRQALVGIREAIYPETVGDGWQPRLPDRAGMPRIPDEMSLADTAALLPPHLADQLFLDDEKTRGMREVRVGGNIWMGVDMSLGPETPSTFVQLVANLRRTRMPYRVSILIEGDAERTLYWKRSAANLLAALSSTNAAIRDSLENLFSLRERTGDFAVLVRVSLATWAPEGEPALLRRRAAALAAGLQSWGVCQASRLAGDPLEGVMSSAPGIAVASTAPYHGAPLLDVMRMLPCYRVGSPWEEGAILFRTPEGRPWHYDPTGRMRNNYFELIAGDSGHGKSMLSNSMIIGLILSDASQSTYGARIPQIGINDIGSSGKGAVDLVQACLPPERRHEALYVPYDRTPQYAFNPFDLQVGCRDLLPIERASLESLISLGCTPLGDRKEPFEGMDGLISATITESYRLCSDFEPNSRPKLYDPTLVPEVGETLRRHRVQVRDDARWYDVVDALCDCGEHRVAGLAQRHAVPVLPDLIEAVRATHIEHQYGRLRLPTGESLIEVFQRYVTELIEWFPNLSGPTVFDTGEARLIVLDLEAVAPDGGSAKDNRQTEIMYMIGDQILTQNMYLRPGYARMVPKRVQAYHRKRFTEIREGIKRIVYDEYRRISRAPRIEDRVDLKRSEGRKHNVHVCLASQRLSDYSERLAQQASAVFLLGAGNEDAAAEACRRLSLSPASQHVVRHKLKGPGMNGEGAPFLLKASLAGGGDIEQMLYNTLGPIELWALSTRPEDVALRDRLDESLGAAETWRRLAAVFPNGTAKDEIGRRKSDLIRRGVDEKVAQANVVGDLARELLDGVGIGLVLVQAKMVERAA